MTERLLSDRIREVANKRVLTFKWSDERTTVPRYMLRDWVQKTDALEAENARLLGIEEQLQGIIRAQLAEINHHMDENARLRKANKRMSEEITVTISQMATWQDPMVGPFDGWIARLKDACDGDPLCQTPRPT